MTTLGSLETVHYTCPECGWTGDFDARFPAWCVRYDHGLNAMSAEELERVHAEKGRARRRREAGRSRAEALQQRLAQAAELRPGAGPRLASFAFSVLTHAVTVAVVAGAVLLMTIGRVVPFVLGLIVLGVAWVVRPRSGGALKKVEGAEWKSRSDLPQFFGLLDQVAAATGAPTPRKVRFNAAYNAGTARRGWGRVPVLVIGLPLWTMLRPEERIALLGHELGHQVNGDTTHGLFARSAAGSLSRWRQLFAPAHAPGRRVRYFDSQGRTLGRADEQPRLQAVMQAAVVTLVLSPVFLVTILLSRLQAWLGTHVSLRAEFAADGIAARAGSTEGALGLLNALAIVPSATSYVLRAQAARKADRTAPARPTEAEGARLMAGLAEYVAGVPEHEYLRRRRISEFRGTSVDASHPETSLRIRLLAERPAVPAAVVVGDGQWVAVDAELAREVARSGAELLR